MSGGSPVPAGGDQASEPGARPTPEGRQTADPIPSDPRSPIPDPSGRQTADPIPTDPRSPLPDPSRIRPAVPITAGQRKRRRLPYFLAQSLCQFIFLTFFRGRVFGTRHIPKRGGALLVCNHQSFLDPPLATVAVRRECEYMARDTLWNVSWLARLMDYLNAFPVKRGAADTRAIKELIRRLRAGGLILAFPEATRTSDGSIGEMRPGVVLVARKTGVPIIPGLILGAFEAWPRTRKLPRPHPVIIAYGEALHPHLHPEWSDEDCIRIVRERIVALYEEYRTHPLLHGRA